MSALVVNDEFGVANVVVLRGSYLVAINYTFGPMEMQYLALGIMQSGVSQ